MMEPVASCLALVASVCIIGPAKIEVVQNTIWTGARIQAGHVNIVATAASDNLQMGDPSSMEVRCVSGKCFRYTRRCMDLKGEARCKFYYDTTDLPYLREIEFIGSNLDEIRKTWSVVRFAPYNGIRVEFGDLRFDNGSESPPINRSRDKRW